jgi:hypothetical protein
MVTALEQGDSIDGSLLHSIQTEGEIKRRQNALARHDFILKTAILTPPLTGPLNFNAPG